MEPIIDYKNKSIKCIWCSNYDDVLSICNVSKIKLKARKKRRCEYFTPDHKKLDKEINKGNNIKKYKRPDWYFLKGSEKKKFIIKEETKRMLQETPRDDSHPLTGVLGNISSTAGVD